MNATIPDITAMTLEQKLRLMEDLWEDLSRKTDGVEPPAWHADVLAAREAAVDSGQAQFESWNDAKNRIEHDIQ